MGTEMDEKKNHETDTRTEARLEQKFPDAWTQAATRSDGSRKPAILYYVSPSPLFTDGEQMLAKIRDVLRVFEEHREDVVMLWHQDPLLKDCLPQSRPAVWAAYEELLRDAQQMDCVIVDDTSAEDAQYFSQIQKDYPGPGPTPAERRAIAFCAAFYGDPGFLGNCFRSEGKPVMLQAPDILAYEAS